MLRLSASVVFIGVLLSACGGSRDEPFNPGDPDDPEPTPVTVTTLFTGTEPFTLIEFEGKRLQVATELDDYYQMIDAYTDQPITTPDFSSGQVVLYDGGVVDDSLCAHKLILRRVDAQNIAEGVVEVTLEYENFQPQSDPECGDEVIEVRPFEFFYVHSRDELVFAERIQGVRSGSSGGNQDDDTDEDEGSEGSDADDPAGF